MSKDDPTEDRRNPYRSLDMDAMKSLLGDRRLASASLIRWGRSCTNYRVEVDGKDCVLRLHAPEVAERERVAMKLASQVVPVPELLDCGDDWSLMAFVEGEHLAARPEVTLAAAQIMATIWTITFDRRGWVKAPAVVVPFDFGGGNGEFITCILKHPDVQKWLDADAIRVLAAIVAEHDRGDANAPVTGCLVHGDFNPTNVLVRNGEVVAVLDWEFAHSGEPFMDIANLVRNTSPEYHQAIWDGIASAGVRLPHNWLERCDFQHLGSYLEFLTSGRADSFKRECVNWILAFIDKFN